MLWEEIAHWIVYAGSSLVLLAALLMVIAGIDRLIRSGLARQGIARGSLGQKLGALVRNPLHFGFFAQMILLQPIMVFPGQYTAVKLDEVFRTWPLEAERRILVGHWHILTTTTAVMMLFLVADQPVAGRLARLLVAFSSGREAGPIPRSLTLDEIATRIGTTREVVCRFLHRFADLRPFLDIAYNRRGTDLCREQAREHPTMC